MTFEARMKADGARARKRRVGDGELGTSKEVGIGAYLGSLFMAVVVVSLWDKTRTTRTAREGAR